MSTRKLHPTGPRQWRSLDELAETPAARSAAENEFPPGTFDPRKPFPSGLSRRHFLGLVGTTAILATACSRRDRGCVVPYTKRPPEVVPGCANVYASTFAEGGRAHSVLVKAREGRPILVTANAGLPDGGGQIPLQAMADILGLYDPARLRAPRAADRGIGWDEALRKLAEGFSNAQAGGRRMLLLTGATSSPARRKLLDELKARFKGLDIVFFEPAPSSANARAAIYGSDMDLLPRLDRARVVLSLGADFLDGDYPELVAAFARRKVQEPQPRMWAMEGSMSLTGAAADHRFPIRPSRLGALGFGLARELHLRAGLPLPRGTDLSSLPSASKSLEKIPLKARIALLSDLKSAGPEAVVLCGEAMPPEAHGAAALLNAMLATHALEARPRNHTLSAVDLPALAKEMAKGQVGAVLFWGVNPSYAAPEAEAWSTALARVPFKAWMGLREDESSAGCDLLLPEHHWLEAWGDHETSPGRLSLQQPVIRPMHDTRQGEQVLLDLLARLGPTIPAASYLRYLQTRWEQEVQTSSLVPFKRFWEAALHEGGISLTSQAKCGLPCPRAETIRAQARFAAQADASGTADLELLLSPCRRNKDGRYAANAWLQELPDPVSKITWGNPLMLAVEDAKKLGLRDGDLVALHSGSRRLEVPVAIQPGQAQGLLSLTLGYGRQATGLAQGIGVNAFPLLTPSPAPNSVLPVRIERLGRRVELPITQGHHRMEGRDLARSYTLAEYATRVREAPEKADLASLYPAQQYPEHKWAMVIDLNACIGCGACVIACQAENNIPIVGAEQVAKGREMHWIRVDRYYEGVPENPRVIHQPMLCQQCDHAPCENVCPVNATTHSPDGLNQMTYNRCVGTRYCANNCPYKVRRFNFLEYTAHEKEPESLVHNPEVTVRPRGVMEKCSFCVQRIQEARMQAKMENRSLKDGEVQPACAVACPTQAIVFGDLKDPESCAARLSRDPRGYKVLEELGVRPAITYLAKLWNPATGGSHEA